MFLQCLKCRLCSDDVPDEQLRFLSIGRRNAPVLFLDSHAETTWMHEREAQMLDLDFGEEVSEQAIAAIGMFIRHHDMTLAPLLKVVGDPANLEISWAVRCESGEVTENMLDSCSMYTRYLLNDRLIIMATAPAYEQLELDNLPDFTEGKLFKTPIGIVMTVKTLNDWDSADISKYITLFSRATKEVGLA